MNAGITGEIPHIDGGQSPAHFPYSGNLLRRRARRVGPMLRAAVVSTVTLRRFRL